MVIREIIDSSLKQFIIDLIVTGDGNIPIFLEAASGNQSDKKAFGKIAKNYQKQLKMETTIAGRFIIATNLLERESFSCDEMLIKYKEQQNVERGFAFLKDPLSCQQYYLLSG